MISKNNDNILKKIRKNYGLEILRIILSFWILINHCTIINNLWINKLLNSQLHVPSFMIISFYFYFRNLIERNINKIELRFQRLLIPYIIWPICFFFINNLLYLVGCSDIFHKKLLLKDFILQIIFGRKYHLIFWYQFNLIIITLLFTIICLLFKSNFILILQNFAIISFFLQYYNTNYSFFILYTQLVNHSVGCIVEMLPFAVIGLTLSSINLINTLSRRKVKSSFFCFVIIFFILSNKVFKRPNGFNYPGIKVSLGGISFFVLFSNISFENLNSYATSIISLVSNYTGGIYYLHTIIRDVLKTKILLIEKKSIYGGLIIYLISYLICLIGIKLFRRTKLKYLFY